MSPTNSSSLSPSVLVPTQVWLDPVSVVSSNGVLLPVEPRLCVLEVVVVLVLSLLLLLLLLLGSLLW